MELQFNLMHFVFNFISKILNECAIHFSKYPKNSLGSISYLLKLERYYVTLTKPGRNAIPSLGYFINTMG
jgi:hypothetical protein